MTGRVFVLGRPEKNEGKKARKEGIQLGFRCGAPVFVVFLSVVLGAPVSMLNKKHKAYFVILL